MPFVPVPFVGAGSKPARCKISRRYRLPRVGAGFPRPCGIIAGRQTMLHSPILSFRGGRRPTWESVLFFCVPHRTQRGCGLPRRFAPRNDMGGGIPPGVGYAGQLTTGRHTGRPLPVAICSGRNSIRAGESRPCLFMLPGHNLGKNKTDDRQGHVYRRFYLQWRIRPGCSASCQERPFCGLRCSCGSGSCLRHGRLR